MQSVSSCQSACMVFIVDLAALYHVDDDSVLAQQQQKQKLTSIQNMSVSVCNFVNMFDYLQVSVSVVVLPCETVNYSCCKSHNTVNFRMRGWPQQQMIVQPNGVMSL